MLFGAGGVLGALVLPAIALIVGVLGPCGAVDLAAIGPAAVGAFGLALRLAVHALVALLLFHAGHRLHHGLHDLKLPRGWASRGLCYGPGWAWIAVAALDAVGALRWLIPLV
jgi:fumarate reductase subunit D